MMQIDAFRPTVRTVCPQKREGEEGGGELTMDSSCPSLPRPTPTPDPPLPPDPSPFPGPPLPEPTPTPDPPLPPDPSPFPGPPITIGQFTTCSHLPLKGWSGLVPYCAH